MHVLAWFIEQQHHHHHHHHHPLPPPQKQPSSSGVCIKEFIVVRDIGPPTLQSQEHQQLTPLQFTFYITQSIKPILISIASRRSNGPHLFQHGEPQRRPKERRSPRSKSAPTHQNILRDSQRMKRLCSRALGPRQRQSAARASSGGVLRI